MAAFAALLVPLGILAGTAGAAAAAPPIVGNGFTVTPADLAFILKQIKIAERHALTLTPANPCGTLVNQPGDGIPDAEQVPDILTSYGLRTVDGSCNNLKTGSTDSGFQATTPSTQRSILNAQIGAADQPFPRLTKPVFRDAEASPPGFPPAASSSYKQKTSNPNLVFDSQPRTISNLIVDQTSTNPAAVAAAGFPVRTQNATGVFVCTDPPANTTPAGCVPQHQTLFIPNVTTDVGLSPPYNSMFTFFGQFFDHGVDQTVKSGATVFVPLKADDPLLTLGPDGDPNTPDQVPPNQAFMVLTRAQNQPGPDGVLGTSDDVQDANNTDSPWVDQSQTYTSHPSHQVFLREYALNAANHPVNTGKLLGGLPAGQTYAGSPDGQSGIGTWKAVKLQAAQKLGLLLQDKDVTDVPMVAVDPYGNLIPGPARGLAQYVTATGLVEGNLATPVAVPANALHFDTPFLTDIAHNADPSPQDTDHNPATPPVAPTPDADSTPSADFAAQPAGTYDDEMLDAHFSCGDGRCNENIALSSIHQIFHSEHDRLVDYVKNVLTTDTSAAGTAALAQWQLPTADSPDGWNGSRLFQAARFVTEMEYQHLVFEEFARKVQPAVRPFHVYSPDINPAVKAEFAHAVYRFGHSMLDDDVARTNTDPVTGAPTTTNNVKLLTAFLNPPEYFNGGPAGVLTPEQAAGSIIMGSSDQVGNELDEFVTETLRNNLLGLPLDLPTINMTRARSEGIPPLNEVRRQINAQTNDTQLAPYTDWSDFGQHLKHPESLINFVAAYGLHPSITAETTLAGKRAAAKLIVDPANPADPAIPADAADFMFGTGNWANGPGGVTTTGLDNVDLWVGGLAEITNLFGGLLGTTFNYVFQTQLETLQDNDRFYYLLRTPGLNLRTQLEGNSFAELIQRNTAGTTNTLKADAFATADCKFQIGNITSPYNGVPTAAQTASGLTPLTGADSVNDDPTSADCDENQLLLKKPSDGTVQYRQFNKINPSGINGQSVYNGTGGVDRVFGGNDNDTFWGGLGNDRIEGNGGDDVALGGEGNDILTDLGGADVSKGGPGNDAIDTGIGDDIITAGDGQDFINGGQNDNEEFAGPGNDFIILGAGADAAFGDGGDDWMEGGTGQDLIQGDHGAPFFDDPAQVKPGNDIMVGQPGENDYDAEGGDDLMAQNAAIDRNAGAAGFDWAFHQYDTVGADDDMEINNNLVGVPIQVVVNRDRWQETEANSGSAFNDVIKGTSVAPATIGGAGFAGCDALDPAGVARIAGLDALVTTFPSSAATVTANSAAGFCPLTGLGSTVPGQGGVWGEGDILLGGAGSDTITGRGADDVIDGDKFLSVKISVRTDPANPATELGSTDLMENVAKSGTFGAGTAGMTLQQAVFAGLVDPGNLVAVREILSPAAGSDTGSVDTAAFAGPRSNYAITQVAPGKVTVNQTGANVVGQKVSDGIDTLTGIEKLAFSDGTVDVATTVGTPAAPAIGTATAGAIGSGSATVTFTAPAPNGSSAITSFQAVATPATGPVITVTGIAPTATSATVTGLAAGVSYTFQVRAVNAAGPGPLSAASNPVTVFANVAPAAPVIGTATPGNTTATVTFTPGAANGGPPVTSFTVQVVNGAGTTIRTVTLIAGSPATVTGLTNGTAVRLRVAAVNSVGIGLFSALSDAVTPATVPGAPGIAVAAAGAPGGARTATVLWTAAASTGGSAITGYQVIAQQVNAANVVIATIPQPVVGPAVRTFIFTSTAAAGARFRFQVVAINAIGVSAPRPTGIVTPQ